MVAEPWPPELNSTSNRSNGPGSLRPTSLNFAAICL
jgi:hypothetical protein